MLMLRPQNVVVLNGQARFGETLPPFHDDRLLDAATLLESDSSSAGAENCRSIPWKLHGSACWKSGGNRPEVRALSFARTCASHIAFTTLCAPSLRAGAQLSGSAQPSFFAKLSAAAWPPPAGGPGNAQAVAGAAVTAPPSTAASATASMTAGGRQAAAPAPAKLRGTLAARRVDGNVRSSTPAAPTVEQTRTVGRSAAPSQPQPGASPGVLSPDVIQISSGSSDGARTQPAAADRSPLEDSLTSDRSSRGKRSQPDSCAERSAEGRCAVRRRVVLDSDTEVSGLMADLDARRESTARAGPAAQLDSQGQHRTVDAVLDEGGGRRSSQANAAPADSHTRSRSDVGQANAADRSASITTGRRHDAAPADVVPATAAGHAAAVDGADAAIAAARLAELIASTSPLRPEAAPNPRLFRAADCSVIRMPVPLRFKDDTNAPLQR